MTRDEMTAEIKGFADLSENWDSYGGIAPNQKTIVAALDIANVLPDIYINVLPVNDGSIMFSTDDEGIMIEVYSPEDAK